MKKNDTWSVLVTDKNRYVRDLLLRELRAEKINVCCGVACGEIYEFMRSPTPPAVVILDPELFDDAQQALLPHLFKSLPDTLFLLHTFLDVQQPQVAAPNVCLVAKNGKSVEVIRGLILSAACGDYKGLQQRGQGKIAEVYPTQAGCRK